MPRSTKKAAKPSKAETTTSSKVAPIAGALLDDVRDILRRARRQAYAAAHFIMVEAYWRIGERIVIEEQGGKTRADYGSFLIRDLARGLGDEFGQGVSVANLKNFRQFFLTFPDLAKSYAARSQLSWTHWRQLMRVENEAARDYYIREAAEQGWNTRELERQINTLSFERLLSAPKANAVTKKASPKPLEIIKDPYVLDFLDLSKATKPSERTLEAALVDRLHDFIMELGKGFAFIGRQFHIATETGDFYVDLVFYNYLLKCFVLIDLKTRKLVHQDIGQMDMYVRMFDDLKRGEGDNPTLGLILCSDKDQTVVRYSVLSESQQLFASKYRLILPSEEELREELERRHILQPPDCGDD
jgi:predicted nuclease of restriction endonuclease-like (RecB) superfamily